MRLAARGQLNAGRDDHAERRRGNRRPKSNQLDLLALPTRLNLRRRHSQPIGETLGATVLHDPRCGCSTRSAASSAPAASYMPIILIARILQGLGGGALLALAYPISRALFPQRLHPQNYRLPIDDLDVIRPWSVP